MRTAYYLQVISGSLIGRTSVQGLESKNNGGLMKQNMTSVVIVFYGFISFQQYLTAYNYMAMLPETVAGREDKRPNGLHDHFTSR